MAEEELPEPLESPLDALEPPMRETPAPPESVTLSMQFSIYASVEEVAAQAVAAYQLAGGGQQPPEPEAGWGEMPDAPEPMPLEITPLGSGPQPDSDLGPIPRVGYPGIRTEDEAPPREPPPEPFPEVLPEGP